MRYLDLFSGYGGFSLGIQQAYESSYANGSQERGSEKDSQGNKGQRFQSTKGKDISSQERPASERLADRINERPFCIGFSEIDKYAIQVYKKHFNHKNYGNITTINPAELPDFDLLCGGFPCQAFSIAGKRQGFEDTRGTLIFDVFRILKEKHPRFVLLENVKGLLSHDNGRTFKTIITSLNELGYAVEWQVLNAKNFGVPQNRERVFIIGHLGGFGGRQVFPIGGEPTEDTRTVGKEVSYTIDASYAKGTNTLEKSRRQVVRQPLKFLDRNQKNIEGDYAFTVDSMNTGGVKIDAKIRRLTPIECERLMGLKDNWTAEGTEGKISDTQRYKLCGNGVVVNVVKEIMTRLLEEKYL